MSVQFTHPGWLWLLPPALAWVIWLSVRTHVQTSGWRRWLAMALRLAIVSLVILAIAGMQWRVPQEGMNVFFLIDRSDSIPGEQTEAAKEWINRVSADKKSMDRAGVIAFGAEAAIEFSPNAVVKLEKIQAVVGSERTDIASALRLGTAAFPEDGQKRLVLLSDGNENLGEAIEAVLAAKPLDVTVDVVPMGVARRNDVSLRKIGVPDEMKKGQTFDLKMFVQADAGQEATVRLFRNEQYLGEKVVTLSEGKNLFSIEQTLEQPGFYKYEAVVDAAGDLLPRNNRSTGFASVRGDPRVLIVSEDPERDAILAGALRGSGLEAISGGLERFPPTLAEMQSYDSIFLSNIAAGDLGDQRMKLLESAVRDFGVGLVCIGGDQSFAAGAYRGTPLEEVLPVSMELSSKKVLPKGALALVMHGMEFNNGNQMARDIAFGALQALGPRDEMGVLLWDGRENWLFELQEVGDKRKLGRLIAGMNQGDLPSFQNLMSMGYGALKDSDAHLKHMIVFSDGDPDAPTDQLMQDMVAANITVSTVLIAGHAGPQRMIDIANKGNGRFYHVTNPAMLPQIFIKETAVILKSAIFEKPFAPQLVSGTELVRGLSPGEVPVLNGYVATTSKPRAELPLVTENGDPLLAHWQYGLGRAAAFTSDARPKWAAEWMGWGQFQQFWSQVAKWSLRRLDNADFSTEVSVEGGEGVMAVEALDEEGNYRNFLNLQSVVVSPSGEREIVPLEQTGPGRYEARFPTREVGAYMMNLMEMADGSPVGSKAIGASVDYSPEFNDPAPNLNRLRRIAEISGGRLLDPADQADNPFLHGREKTFQPRDLWPWLLQLAILLFPLDVGIRRIQIDREEWSRATETLRRFVLFWKKHPSKIDPDKSLSTLLATRDRARESTRRDTPAPRLFQPSAPPAVPDDGGGRNDARTSGQQQDKTKSGEKKEASEAETTDDTTSRLLAAKRRAQRRRK